MKVKLLGKDYGVAFNMAVQIDFEDTSGKPFDLESLNTQKATMQLCYASLKQANGKLPFTFDELLSQISSTETSELKNAVMGTMKEWFGLPAVMQSDDEQPEEDDLKNA